MATSTVIDNLNARIVELEESIIQAVAEIDQSDSSRVGLQQTLDTVRETLADVYGDTLTDDVNEHLGIETVDGDIDEDEDEE